jgi:hypothetical protein
VHLDGFITKKKPIYRVAQKKYIHCTLILMSKECIHFLGHSVYNHIQLFGNKYIFKVVLRSDPPLIVQFIKSLFKTTVETFTEGKHHRTKQKDISQVNLETAI